MALEKIRQQENSLREAMQLYGRPGLWSDWLRFQAAARVQRQKDAEQAKKAREKLWEIVGFSVLGIVGLGVTFFVLAIIYMAWRS